MRQLHVILTIAMFPPALLHAQQVQKCCGTSNSTFLLGNTAYATHSQCIYLPADFTGAMPGNITRLYYRHGSTGQDLQQTLTNFRVGFVQNSATSFVNHTFYTGVTQALNTPQQIFPPGTTGNWFAIELDEPFPYDPSLTLIVDIMFDESAVNNWGTSASSASGRKLYWSDNNSPTGESVVSSLQDVGFDLSTPTMVPRVEPMIFSMHPNPAGDRLYLEIGAAQDEVLVEVLDTSGRMVLATSVHAGSSHRPLDVSALTSGLYILNLRNRDGSVESHRFVRE